MQAPAKGDLAPGKPRQLSRPCRTLTAIEWTIWWDTKQASTVLASGFTSCTCQWDLCIKQLAAEAQSLPQPCCIDLLAMPMLTNNLAIINMMTSDKLQGRKDLLCTMDIVLLLTGIYCFQPDDRHVNMQEEVRLHGLPSLLGQPILM